jgi:3-isopropylmalate dehydrogenase
MSRKEPNTWHILVLAGDGIGPEVTNAALEVLRAAVEAVGISLEVEEDLAGGACYDQHGTFLCPETLERARQVDAILFGAEGGPKWDALDLPGGPTDKSGLSKLRKELDLFANIRPVRAWPAIADRTPFRPDVIAGADLIVLRELTSGIYFGEPRGIIEDEHGLRGLDTQSYTAQEIDRCARVAFELAQTRRGKVTSVDKANVMESGILWRRRMNAVATEDYPDIELEHLYADACLYELVRNPRRFDVIVADNLFGDLLSDCAATIAGSLGLLPSASLGLPDQEGRQIALYEPVHGSAPDIAGKGIANPIAAILSSAMMCEMTFGRPDIARAIEGAVESCLQSGCVTADLGASASTEEVAKTIVSALSDGG